MKKSVLSALLFIFLVSAMLFTGCNDTEDFTSDTSDTASECVHDYGEWIEEIPAECEKEGIKGHYHCNKCQKDFDKEYNELESLTVPPTGGHNYVNGVCTGCGACNWSKGLEYTLNGDSSSYYVSGIGSCTDKEIVIPSVYEGLPVTSIGDHAFEDCASIINITIPNSVTSIGIDVFGDCYSLTSVTIGNNVTSIGDYAFGSCYKLVEVINKSALDIKVGSEDYGCIGYYAKEVHNGTSKIDNKDGYLFYTYDNVNYLLGYSGSDASLTLPTDYNGEKYEIYEHAFCACTSTNITVSDSITSIGEYAFYKCTSLTSVTIGNGVTSIDYEAFGACTSLTSITIPDSVTSVGYGAFYGCTSLTSITIPNSVTSIGEYAFGGCTSLKSITIPNSATKIGRDVFNGCTSLVSVTIPDSVTSIGRDAFNGCTSLASVTIGNGVTSIGNGVFEDCISLTSITIPNSVTTSIGRYAFKGCKGLKSVTIGNGVTSIDYEAFGACTSLTSVTIGNGVTSIDYEAFGACTSLTSITIPDNVISICRSAFRDCSSLTSVTFSNTSGWKYGSSSDTIGTAIDVTDASQNVFYLTFIYCDYYWKRS